MQLKLFLIIFIFLIIPSVFGLGVSPADVKINFIPNLETSFVMTVYNNPAKNQDVEVYASLVELDKDVVEEFRKVISLEKTALTFTEQEAVKNLTVNIKLPAGISKPGVHELRVGAIKTTGAGEEGMSIFAGNEIRILINVSGQYASDHFAKIKRLKILSVIADDVEKGKQSYIEVVVKSESDVRLDNVYGKIKVIKDNKEIKTLDTNNISLETGQEKSLETALDTKRIDAGVLILNVSVYYDSKAEKAQGTLKIFEPNETETPSVNSWWIWIIIILLLIIIIILLFFLLRRKKNMEEQNNKIYNLV